MQPRNLAARAGRWSAQHRKTAILGWIAFVVFATFLGYGTTLLTLVAFYLLASVWFVLFRYRYVRRGRQFTMPWPRPKGY